MLEVKSLQRASSLMHWDQQVFMPIGGAPARAEHLARLAGMAHRLATSEESLRLLESAEKAAAPGTPEAAEARVVRRELDRMTKLPVELVERKSRAAAAAYADWRVARAEADFARMLPHYEGLFGIARETSDALGYEDHPYDPLLDSFEEGAKTADAAQMFRDLHEPTQEIIQEFSRRAAPTVDLRSPGNEELRSFMEGVTKTMGFDYGRGRLDVTTNAFCSTFSQGDVRMTTRATDVIKGIVFSSLHEMGHGLYEQNSPADWDLTPLGGGISLGIHESQSRLWENIIGRSVPFWQWCLPGLAEICPWMGGVSPEEFAAAVSHVTPGMIRIGSDEVTYNMHIRIRFECEVEIVTGKLAVKDLPEAWNEKMRAYLGVVPAHDGEGVLQDVHWSRGSVGYFPTYCMGNLIGWQVWECLLTDLPNTSERMASGDFSGVLGWLSETVYSQAKLFPPRQLLLNITGKPMDAGAFVRGMRGKFGMTV